MSNMRETCDMCNHKAVCKNVDEAYALQGKVDKIVHSDSFEVNVVCKNYKQNYGIVRDIENFKPVNPYGFQTWNPEPSITGEDTPC